MNKNYEPLTDQLPTWEDLICPHKQRECVEHFTRWDEIIFGWRDKNAFVRKKRKP